jgi:hypothetical protein
MNLSLLSGWGHIFFSCFLRNKTAEKRARSKQSEQKLSSSLLREESAVDRSLSNCFLSLEYFPVKGTVSQELKFKLLSGVSFLGEPN